MPPAKIIFQATGWDVLRLEDQQGESSPLTLEFCRRLRRPQLYSIYVNTYKPTRVARSISKKNMLGIMFPNEPEAPTTHKTAKRKHAVNDLGALRAAVRGPSTTSHSVYDRWHLANNDIDRMDQDYALFYCTAYHGQAEKQGLESVIFFMLMSLRALWEEHRCQRAYDASNRNHSAVPKRYHYTIPEFILAAASQLLEE